MLSKWNFHLPLRLEFGRGRAQQIGRLVADAAAGNGGLPAGSLLLVGYRHSPPLDKAYSGAVDSLRAAGLSVETFLQVVPEPDEQIAIEGAELARRLGVGMVLGLGGGSVIDAAKGIAALAVGDGPLWEHSTANQKSRPIDRALPIIAVPTTAGTGAEATSVAVFRQHGVGPTPDEPVKAITYGPALLPALAVVDPAFFDTMPAELAAACGADALSHSIEAVTSRLANPVCTAMGSESVRLLLKYLVVAVGRKNSADTKEIKKAREAVTLATVLSGIAVNGPGVTAAHAAAHALGALLHIPHGKAVALTAMPLLRFNTQACIEPYARLAQTCGLAIDEATGEATDDLNRSGNEEKLAQRFVDALDELWQTLNLTINLPRRLEPSNPAERDKLIKRLAQNAMDGTPLPLRNNARKIDLATLERILADIVCQG